jgi:hypothetical protein
VNETFIPELRFPTITKLLVLTLHGLIMWITVPLSYVVTCSTLPIWRRRGASIAEVVGWIDLNVIALMFKTVARPLVITTPKWVSLEDAKSSGFRVSILDII